MNEINVKSKRFFERNANAIVLISIVALLITLFIIVNLYIKNIELQEKQEELRKDYTELSLNYAAYKDMSAIKYEMALNELQEKDNKIDSLQKIKVIPINVFELNGIIVKTNNSIYKKALDLKRLQNYMIENQIAYGLRGNNRNEITSIGKIGVMFSRIIVEYHPINLVGEYSLTNTSQRFEH